MLDSRVYVVGILGNRANPLMARPILKTRTVTDTANSIHVHTLGLVILGSNQVVLSSMSPTSDADAAAPDVDVPSPFALSGASLSLHARHEEQRFCSYSSHSNGSILGMATMRRGGYRIAVLAFY